MDWTKNDGLGVHKTYSGPHGSYTIGMGVEPANYDNNIRQYLSVRGTDTINFGGDTTVGINGRVKLDNDLDPKSVTSSVAVAIAVPVTIAAIIYGPAVTGGLNETN